MKRKDIEESLEIIWHLKENHAPSIEGFRKHDIEQFGEKAVYKLEAEGYIVINNESIKMTRKGEKAAKQVVRRHRLAERLLTDVLGMNPDEVEKGACEFEHILAPELTESICTLLGHPKQCPHGTNIPQGDCCERQQESISSAVVPLTDAAIGEEHKVAYINTQLDSRVQKLFQFQIFPGTTVKISQRYPSFVLQSKNTQLAMEAAIVKEIFVWKNGNE